MLMKYQDGQYNPYLSMCASFYWRYEWWCSLWPRNPYIQEQIKAWRFYSRIFRLQQEINLSVETVSSTRLLLQYMKSLSKCDKIKASINPKLKDLITFLDNNGKLAIYAGKNIHVIYCYLEIIGTPTNLTSSVRHSHNFGTSSSTNNYTVTLQTVVSGIHVWKKFIF